MNVLIAQLGARRHYVVPRALHLQGLLHSLITDLCGDVPPWVWANLLPDSVRPTALRRLLARHAEGVPPRLIHNLTGFALSPFLQRRAGKRGADFWARRNRAFCEAVAARGFEGSEAVYAFNGAALEIFQAARKLGINTIIDQTAAPWRFNKGLLEEETRNWPGWEDSPSEIDASGALARREEAEWPLADRIVCGSAFAADAVAVCGGDVERCAVVPYSGYSGAGNPVVLPSDDRAGPVRVLFVGTLQLRKGIQYLAEAAAKLGGDDIVFRAVGPNILSRAATTYVGEHIELVGPIPRDRVADHYRWADIFVLPTLSEGSANVVYEAMAAGVAVITTKNAGSIVSHDRTGLLVPSRDAEALGSAITRLASDPNLRRRLGAAGQAAVQAFDLETYAARLAQALEPTLTAPVTASE